MGEEQQREGQAGPRAWIVRTRLQGSFVKCATALRAVDGIPGPVQSTFQIQAIGFGFGRRADSARERAAERTDDPTGDLVLKCEQVIERAIESFGPEMQSSRDIDELRGHPNLSAPASHRPLEDRFRLQAAASLADVDGLSLKRERRAPRNDSKPWCLSEPRK